MTCVRGWKESVGCEGLEDVDAALVVLVVRCEDDVREEDEREREWCGTSNWVADVEESLWMSGLILVVGVGASGRVSRDSSFMSMFQIRTVWSAEQVARSLMSGESKRRVR